jgi:PD-(D/E)XK nuclease superfamily protein
MDVNVSQILAFQRCELDWYFQYVNRRVRRGWNVPLKIGEWWHLLMEHYFNAFKGALHPDGSPDPITSAHDFGNLKIDEMVDEAREAGFETQAIEFRSECIRLLDLFSNRWQLRFPPTSVLCVEEPVRRRLPNPNDPLKDGEHFLVGIPDTVVEVYQKRWHLQHKTASDRTSMPLYIQLAQRSLHELAYAWLLEGGGDFDHKDPLEDYGGTYLNIVRKLSAKAIALNAQSAFVQELIPLDSKQIWEAVLDIARIADRMALVRNGTKSPIDNREADTNRFGNVLSPYFDVKLGLASLRDDNLFTDATTRYDPKEV